MQKSDFLERYVRFGTYADKLSRKRIAEQLQQNNLVEPENSSLDKELQISLNKIISDKVLQKTLRDFPHLQDEIFEKIIENLEKCEQSFNEIQIFENEIDFLKQNKTDKNITISELSSQIENSNLLDSKKQNQYKNLLEQPHKDAESKKDDLFRNLHQKISKNWEKVFDENRANFLKSIYKKDEKLLKENFKKLSPKEFREEWKNENSDYKFIIKKNNYENSFNLAKYQKEFNELENTIIKIDGEKLKLNVNKIFEDWEKKISLEKIRQKIRLIDEHRNNFLQEFYKKIELLKELMKTLSVFVNDAQDFGRLWDLSQGNWKKLNFQMIEEFSEILEKRKDLIILAEMLGRYRKAEAKLEQERIERIETIKKNMISHFGKSELVGITESNDLNNLLPSEIGTLSEFEDVFFKKYIGKKLLSFQHIDKFKSQENKKISENKEKEKEEKGPFILAIDTSGSMHGEPEIVAKTIAFAISKIAKKEKRKAFLISFSTKIETFEISDFGNSFRKLLEFLAHSFNGGTDATDAVKEAIKQMKSMEYKLADLLIISDGIFSEIDTKILNDIEILKNFGNKFNALIIGNSHNNNALRFCDNTWTYDDNKNEIEELVKKIADFSK